MSERDIHITLRLNEFPLSLKVSAEQEELYRRAAKSLNERYNVYRQARPSASVQELWMYVALENAVNLQSDARKNAILPVEEKIKELNTLIKNILPS